MAKNNRRQIKGASRGEVTRIIDFAALPTPERLSKDICFGGVERFKEPESPKSVVMVIKFRAGAECWLDRYHRKGHISFDEHAAGVMFRQAWQYSVQGIQTHDSTTRVAVDSNGLSTADVMIAWQRVYRLCLKKLSEMQKLAVIQCCGMDEAMQTKERVRTLKRALDALSRKSRLLTDAENNFVMRRYEAFR